MNTSRPSINELDAAATGIRLLKELNEKFNFICISKNYAKSKHYFRESF